MLHWMRKTDRIIHTHSQVETSGREREWLLFGLRFVQRFISERDQMLCKHINQWHKNKNRTLDRCSRCLPITNISVSIRTRLIWPNTIRISKHIQMWCKYHLNFEKRSAHSTSIPMKYNTPKSHENKHTFGLSWKQQKKTSKRKPSRFVLILLISLLHSLWITSSSHLPILISISIAFIHNLWMIKLRSTFMYDFSFTRSLALTANVFVCVVN